MIISLLVALCFGPLLEPNLIDPLFASCLLIACAAVLLGVGVVEPGRSERRITADKQCDDGGNPKAFTLTLGAEKVTLDPGKPWFHVDHYKWVTRGLIEEPQSFHILRDGTVEINGDKIRLSDPDGIARLELEVNKHHATVATHKAPPASQASPHFGVQSEGLGSGKVRFKVRLDRLGHLMVECLRGAERVETGLRGLSMLVQNGLMLKPGSVHLDPLQRGIQLDGMRFESSEAGARQLEEALNSKYAPTLKVEHERAVEIRENPASPTGFDIHFVTIRVGARFDVKGHLTQEQLDILQNPTKSDLLQPGVVLRLSPPHLIVRRKRPDGGEERIPEILDVNYLRATAPQLQQFFNHPLIRRSRGGKAEEALSAGELHPQDILEIHLVRHPKDQRALWLECVTGRGGRFLWRALTHHNVAELQRSGIFMPDMDVTLSLDNRILGILNTKTNQEETIAIDNHSSDDDLTRAGQMLAAALKPANPHPGPSPAEAKPLLEPAEPPALKAESVATVPQSAAEPPTRKGDVTPTSELRSVLPPENISTVSDAATETGTRKAERGPLAATTTPSAIDTTRTSPSSEISSTGRLEPETSAAAGEPHPDSTIPALSGETDPLRVNAEIFRRLSDRFGVPVQDARLSLPRVFADRRFEIISFGQQEIDSVLELRGEEFYGFYLSHISEQRIDFVYACQGTHIEWGADKCYLQPAADAEAVEFKGGALLGMGQTADNQFVFFVTPAYKQWVRPYEPRCREAFAHFRTVNELDGESDNYTIIWPDRPPSRASD